MSNELSYFDDEDDDQPMDGRSAFLIAALAALAWAVVGIIAVIIWRTLR